MMSLQYNYSILVGRLTRDPELRRFSETATKLSFTLAVGRSYKRKDGTTVADFIPVAMWGKSAEAGFKILKKGMPILVSGKIQVHSYEKEAEERWMTEVVVDTFELLQTLSEAKGKAQKLLA